MAEKYSLSLKQAAEIFGQYNVLPFIREGFGIFSVEGDEAVFEEVKSFLQSKGAAVWKAIPTLEYLKSENFFGEVAVFATADEYKKIH